jgi:hypothetical protein
VTQAGIVQVWDDDGLVPVQRLLEAEFPFESWHQTFLVCDPVPQSTLQLFHEPVTQEYVKIFDFTQLPEEQLPVADVEVWQIAPSGA